MEDRKVVADLLDKHFAPEGTENRFNYNEMKRAYQQRSFKNALESAELILAKAVTRSEEVSREVVKINETTAMKDSIDVNSRLNGEILIELQKTNMLLAQLVRVNAAQQYQGTVNRAQIGNSTYKNRAKQINFTNERTEDFVLPSGRKAKDFFKEGQNNNRDRGNNNDNWSPFTE